MRFVFSWILFVIAISGSASVKVAEVFSSNMVLQQGRPIHVWGVAAPGKHIVVNFGGQKLKTKVGHDGLWKVELAPMKASFKPQILTIRGDGQTITFNNILIGEVWLASGQSNMEYSMNNHPQFAKPKKGNPNFQFHEWEKAYNPNIRLLYIEKNLKSDTLPTKGWEQVNQKSLKPFSAAAWFFAKMLQDSLKVPVGIISSSWGGTRIEEWTPEIGKRYQKMIQPMVPFAIRGFLWYQGESNLIDDGDTDAYAPKMERLINSWRNAWGKQDLPFYYVQISPLRYSQRKEDIIPKTWIDLPRFWDAQTQCMQIPYTGMVVTTDIPEDLDDIHPPYKWIVGERLGRWALHNIYGFINLECCGPTLKSIVRQGDKVIIEFDHCENGLTTSDGENPNWFYANVQRSGRFAKVKATIDGKYVILDIPLSIEHPIIRFGYDEEAQPNLRNKAGLPAISFEYKL